MAVHWHNYLIRGVETTYLWARDDTPPVSESVPARLVTIDVMNVQTLDHRFNKPLESLDGLRDAAIIKGVFGWSNQPQDAGGREGWLLVTATGRRRIARLERSPGDAIVFHKGAVIGPFSFVTIWG